MGISWGKTDLYFQDIPDWETLVHNGVNIMYEQ